jgi:hypothetical protein
VFFLLRVAELAGARAIVPLLEHGAGCGGVTVLRLVAGLDCVCVELEGVSRGGV